MPRPVLSDHRRGFAAERISARFDEKSGPEDQVPGTDRRLEGFKEKNVKDRIAIQSCRRWLLPQPPYALSPVNNDFWNCSTQTKRY